MSSTTVEPAIPFAETPQTVHTPSTSSKPDVIVKDVVFWRRKTLSAIVLSLSTALWVALKVYELNFVTVASWVAICVVTLMFIVGNIHRMISKEGPDMRRLEMDERYAVETARTIQRWVEEGVRWMFRIGTDGDLFAFAITVTWLWLLSWISSRVDSLTLIYLGVLSGLSVPVMYGKYEHNVKEYGWRLRMQGQKYYDLIKDKLLQTKDRFSGTHKEKEKKTE